MAEKGKDQFVQEFTQGKIPIVNRAPRSTDKGTLWVHYTSSAMTLYGRHPNTGAWIAF